MHTCSQSILCLRRHIDHAGLSAEGNLVLKSFILPSDASVFTSKLRGKVVNLPRQFIFAVAKVFSAVIFVNHSMPTSGSGVLDGILSATTGSNTTK